MKPHNFLAGCLVVFLIACSMAWAQGGDAAVSGMVSDSSGAVLRGASVQVTNTATGVVKTTVTTGSGYYVVRGLIPGTYTLQVSAEGFRPKDISDIKLVVDQEAGINVSLAVGSSQQEVTVTGASLAQLQTTNASVGSVIQSQEVMELPLNGRSFTQLLQLSPGATSTVNTYLFKTSSAETTGKQRNGMPGFNVNGGNGAYVTYQVDGTDNSESEFGGANIPVSIDFIQEVKIETANFSPEYGRGPAQVQVVTKSGTNEFHGALFEFLRNDALDANQWTLTGTPSKFRNTLKRNQFGGSIGGPIKKNKMFFFFNYEGMRQVLSSPRTTTVPTADMRNGIFPSGIVITDPTTGNPFPNNTIPADRIDSVGAQMLDLWPLPNQTGIPQQNAAGFDLAPTQNYFFNPRQTHNINQYNTRIDYNLSNKDTIFGRYTVNRSFILADGVLASNLQGSLVGQEQDNFSGHNLSANWFHTLTPTTINEFRFGISTDPQRYDSLGQTATTDYASQWGLKQFLSPDAPVGLPAITVTGFGSLSAGNTRPYHVSETNLQFVDNLTLIRGSHQIRMGADIYRAYRLPFNVARSRGVFRFSGVQTRDRNRPTASTTFCPGGTVATACSSGNGAADILLGFPSQFTAGDPEISPTRHFTSAAGYIWDIWQVNKSLTLNLGLRYDFRTRGNSNPPAFSVPLLTNGDYNGIVAVANDSNGTMSSLVKPSALAFAPAGQIVTCRSVGLPDNCVSNIHEWQPRIGLAWKLGGNTVVRAGGGMFYSHEFGFIESEEGTASFPFLFQASTPNFTRPPSGLDPPPLSLSAPFGPNATRQPSIDSDTFPSIQEPGSYQWNLTVQRQLMSDTTLSVGYVGTLNRHLYSEGSPHCCFYNVPQPIGVVLAPGRQQVPATDLLATNSTINEFSSNSNYNSLQVAFRRVSNRSLQWTASYTYSKNLAKWKELSDPFNSQTDYGRTDGDLRHNIVVSPIWNMPFGMGRRWLNRGGVINQLAGGWRLTGILSWRSGLPFTPTLSGVDLMNSSGTLQSRPDRICSGNLAHPTVLNWFDKTCFVDPVEPTTPGARIRPGNSGINILSGPSGFNLDMGLGKNFPFSESKSLEFRAEAFNFTNTPSFGSPSAGISPSGNSGTAQISSVVSLPRIIQFALKLHF